MSDHDLSLRALANEITRQASQLIDKPMTQHTENVAKTILNKYVDQMQKRWGIEMVPHFKSDPSKGSFLMEPYPKTELDKAMLEALQRREGMIE